MEQSAVAGVVIYLAPLRVVKDVECLGAEFEVHVLVHGKRFKQAHIEIRACRQVEDISPRGAVGEALRGSERVAVPQPRPLDTGWVLSSPRTVERTYEVGIRLYRSRVLEGTAAVIADRVARSRIIRKAKLLLMLKGVPVWNPVRSEICHPPSKECNIPGWVKKGRS